MPLIFFDWQCRWRVASASGEERSQNPTMAAEGEREREGYHKFALASYPAVKKKAGIWLGMRLSLHLIMSMPDVRSETTVRVGIEDTYFKMSFAKV